MNRSAPTWSSLTGTRQGAPDGAALPAEPALRRFTRDAPAPIG
ncbi:hypothetical protein [Kitasatospora sp. NBC_01266]|nr:hypothetical protein [Kitasatospora sp. NBC_01266]